MKIASGLERLAQKIPGVGGLLEKRRLYLHWARFVPPGHYYSPVPSDEDIERWSKNRARSGTVGLDLRQQEQRDLLAELAPLYEETPFSAAPSSGLRFYYDNPFYTYADAIFLHLILRHLKPRRIVEIGSGFSSAVMLDTVERFLGSASALTFVEPDPVRLSALLRSGDRNHCTVLEKPVQEVGLDPFLALEAGDVLFIDSSHVSKAGSDVNFLLFEVLPRLKPDVWIHFHDILPGFDYREETLRDGIAWNEAYLLHAFLLFNSAFDIVLHTPWCIENNKDWFRDNMPDCLKGTGSSLWIKRS